MLVSQKIESETIFSNPIFFQTNSINKKKTNLQTKKQTQERGYDDICLFFVKSVHQFLNNYNSTRPVGTLVGHYPICLQQLSEVGCCCWRGPCAQKRCSACATSSRQKHQPSHPRTTPRTTVSRQPPQNLERVIVLCTQ